MKVSLLNTVVIGLATVSIVGCEFTGSSSLGSSKATSAGTINQLNNGDSQGDEGSASGIRVSNLRMCYRQSPAPSGYQHVYALYQMQGGVAVTTPSQVQWSVAVVTQAQATSGFSVMYTAIMNSANKVSGTFRKSSFTEPGGVTVPRFEDLEKETINLNVSESRMAELQAAAAATNGAVVLMFHDNGRVLATNTVQAAPTGGGSALRGLQAGSQLAFQIVTPLISRQDQCAGNGDLPPEMSEMCENECDTNESPLVLDLKGDGIVATSLENGVQFDIDGDGKKNQTAWIQAQQGRDFDDAFLARDINGNGRIDGGAELFGQATRLRSGQMPVNGFVALKDLDSNGDNIFDSKDLMYKDLVLWSDKNQNGVSERGELTKLSYHVESMDLNFQAMSDKDAYGNKILASSTFKDHLGQVRSVIDIFFKFE